MAKFTVCTTADARVGIDHLTLRGQVFARALFGARALESAPDIEQPVLFVVTDAKGTDEARITFRQLDALGACSYDAFRSVDDWRTAIFDFSDGAMKRAFIPEPAVFLTVASSHRAATRGLITRDMPGFSRLMRGLYGMSAHFDVADCPLLPSVLFTCQPVEDVYNSFLYPLYHRAKIASRAGVQISADDARQFGLTRDMALPVPRSWQRRLSFAGDALPNERTGHMVDRLFAGTAALSLPTLRAIMVEGSPDWADPKWTASLARGEH